MILRFLTSLYVLTRTKSATKYIILWKVIITSFKISNCFYLVIFHKKKSQGTKYGTQNVHFFDVTPYIIFTHPVFLRLHWHIWHPGNISFPTIYNFMGVKCTHYKLCSVQSKLVYFSQFWDMKHFLGPVCDIWPLTGCKALIVIQYTVCPREKEKPRFKCKILGHGWLVSKYCPSNLINDFLFFLMIPFTPMLLMWMTCYRWFHNLLLKCLYTTFAITDHGLVSSVFW